MNSSYVASRLAQLHGLRVIDDPDSILICCDKVNMYRHLLNAQAPIPRTQILEQQDLTLARGRALLDELGSPLVLKAPNTSFSMYVEKVGNASEFVRVGRRFQRRANRCVVQEFVVSDFDWRVGVLVTLEKRGFPADAFNRKQLRYLLGRAHGVFFVIEEDKQVCGSAVVLWQGGSATLLTDCRTDLPEPRPGRAIAGYLRTGRTGTGVQAAEFGSERGKH